MKSNPEQDAFESEYATGDEFVDAISLCKNSDGTYQQALARMCFKWFCKGQAAKADSRAMEDAFEQVCELAEDVTGNYSEMTSQNTFECRVFRSRIARLREALSLAAPFRKTGV